MKIRVWIHVLYNSWNILYSNLRWRRQKWRVSVQQPVDGLIGRILELLHRRCHTELVAEALLREYRSKLLSWPNTMMDVLPIGTHESERVVRVDSMNSYIDVIDKALQRVVWLVNVQLNT